MDDVEQNSQQEETETASPIKPWHVSDDDTRALLPPGGFLQDLISYTEGCTHSPLWFQMAAALGMLITACAGRELRIVRKDGSQGYVPMNFWPIIIGESGDGKDAAVRPAMRILMRAAPQYMLATDFTPEALQIALSEGSGAGMIVKSELSHLFKAGRRAYSSDLIEYLMALYNGDPWTRLTRKDGHVAVMRPRVSIIGNIPPDVLIEETTRSMWSSGLLPRMTPFAATRTRWLELESQDGDREQDFADWVQQLCVEPSGPIVFPPHATRVITDWHFKEIEEKRHQRHPDVFSALLRLQEKAFRIGAAIAVSESDEAASGVTSVMPHHAAMAIEIIKKVLKSTVALFSATASGIEAATERRIIELIGIKPGITLLEISNHVGLSRYKLRPIIEGLKNDLDIEIKPITANNGTAWKKGYFLT